MASQQSTEAWTDTANFFNRCKQSDLNEFQMNFKLETDSHETHGAIIKSSRMFSHSMVVQKPNKMYIFKSQESQYTFHLMHSICAAVYFIYLTYQIFNLPNSCTDFDGK